MQTFLMKIAKQCPVVLVIFSLMLDSSIAMIEDRDEETGTIVRVYNPRWETSNLLLAQGLQRQSASCSRFLWDNFFGTQCGLFSGAGTGLFISSSGLFISSSVVDIELEPWGTVGLVVGGVAGGVIGGIGGFMIDRMTKSRGNSCGYCIKILGGLSSFIPWIAFGLVEAAYEGNL